MCDSGFMSAVSWALREGEWCILGGIGLVVHEEEVDIAGIVYEEGFVAGGH